MDQQVNRLVEKVWGKCCNDWSRGQSRTPVWREISGEDGRNLYAYTVDWIIILTLTSRIPLHAE